MPFNRPTLPELLERNATDIESAISPGDAHVRRHKLTMLGRVNAGAAHGMHGHLGFLADQLLPDRADWEGLQRWGSLRSVYPLSAVGASGTITVTGQPAALVKSGELLTRADGWEYLVTQTTNLDDTGSAIVPVVSVEGGYAGNADPSTTVRFGRALSGIAPAAIVVSIGGGADAEKIDAYRDRVIFRWRNPPQQGALHDYEAWAREAHPAVTRAWAYRNEMGPNTVTVRIVTDQDPAGPIPSQAVIDAVYSHIRAIMPATPELYVVAPIQVVVDVEVVLLPDDATVRAAAQLEIQDWFVSDPDLKPAGWVYRSRLSEAISKTPGERAHELRQPATNLHPGTGELPVLGTITWSTAS
ncbi:hypothetical protein NM74_07825 [Aeromonas hydrophila]|uniref:baseplate J/gp47 family protein n=1 Tax=Aeromonas hydrophila TaxID=644 RepID=UPI0005374F40|nr:baseplate J/gp47 family protein [Aeromonas hydrophila]KHA57125.1 hypothetical protein NM74_07825 [Aeromonas hydrophila]